MMNSITDDGEATMRLRRPPKGHSRSWRLKHSRTRLMPRPMPRYSQSVFMPSHAQPSSQKSYSFSPGSVICAVRPRSTFFEPRAASRPSSTLEKEKINMPSMLDDPTSPVVYRISGPAPYPSATNPQIPSSIFPRPVTLRDRVTVATLIPFFNHEAVPPRLLQHLCDTLNAEIEDGNTYPMMDTLSLETFGPYWFGNFGAVMVLGDLGGIEALNDMERSGADWTKSCLGSFYVKPNYPGRSSHVCNGGFLVTSAARNKGVGKSMGQCYLDWAPQLGYTYSVFNLVYETNTASTRIWDSLGFKRIGRVPGCGVLKSFDEPVDAIIYGRDLKADDGNVGSEERFDKIRYYLRHSLYPQGADRSEKSRLRSAATHYKLIPASDGVPEKLMLKDKEVISDPNQQYDIAKRVHLQAHAGINKTTAVIATHYHWVRIKETVSHVIKNCAECKDPTKPPILRSEGPRSSRSKTLEGQIGPPEVPPEPSQSQSQIPSDLVAAEIHNDLSHARISDRLGNTQISDDIHTSRLTQDDDYKPAHISADEYQQAQQSMSIDAHDSLEDNDQQMMPYEELTLDPQIMEQIQAQLAEYENNPQHHQFIPPTLPPYGDASHLSQSHHAHTHPQSTPDYTQPTHNALDNHATHFMTTHSSHLTQHPNQSLDQLMSGAEDTSGRTSAQSMPGPSAGIGQSIGTTLSTAGGTNLPSSLGGTLGGSSGSGQSQGQNSANGTGMNDMQQMRHVLQMEYMNPPPPPQPGTTQSNGQAAYKK